jgi:titin
MRCTTTRIVMLVSFILMLGGCDDPVQPEAGTTLAVSSGSDVPTNVTSTARSVSQIDVSWTDKSSNETGFEVFRSETGRAGTYSLRSRTGMNITANSDLGLTPSTQYCYKVRWYRVRGGKTTVSAFSSDTCATTFAPPPPPVPPAPTGLYTYTSGSSAVGITWDASNALEFRVERSTDGQATWETAFLTQEKWARDENLASDQTICYRVFAKNAVGDSPGSAVRCVTLVRAATGLVATPLGDGAIGLQWVDASTMNTGYEVQYLGWEWGGTWYGWYENWQTLAVLPADATDYRATGVEREKFNEFRVMSLGPSGPGDPSLSAGSWTDTGPLAPSGLDATFVMGGSVSLQWTDNATDETGYVVQRCDPNRQLGYFCTASFEFVTIGTLPPNAASFVDTAPPWGSGDVSAYRVAAVRGMWGFRPSGTLEFGFP